MKGLKVFNIILFSVICAVEIFVLYYFFSFLIMLISGSVAGIVAAILACLPMIVILSGAIIVLSIILTITSKTRIRKLEENNVISSKLDKCLMTLPWYFLMFNVFGFAILVIVSNKK